MRTRFCSLVRSLVRGPCAEPCAGALWASPLGVLIWWSLTNSLPEKVVGGDKCLVKCLMQALCGLVRSFQRESVVWGLVRPCVALCGAFPWIAWLFQAFRSFSCRTPYLSYGFRSFSNGFFNFSFGLLGFVDSSTFAMDSLTFLEDSLQKPPGLV